MTPTRFIEIMEGCYGAYPSMLKSMITRYLERKPDFYLSALSKVVLETFDTSYKVPPGIAKLTELENQVLDHIEYKQQKKLQLEAPKVEKGDPEVMKAFAMLTEKISKGINPRTDSEIQGAIRKFEAQNAD